MSDSMQCQYFFEKEVYHGIGCAFRYEINWNVQAISGSDKANGYIVQHFSSSSVPPNFLIDDTEYYEAWRLRNGKLVDTGAVCDDCFSVGSTLEDSIRRSLGTQGEYRFNGDVYWIPAISPLFTIVDSWTPGAVKRAGGLKSSLIFPELKDEYFIFKREQFVHCWSLITEEEIKAKLEKAYLRGYPECRNDVEYLSDWLDCIFREEPERWKRVRQAILVDLGQIE